MIACAKEKEAEVISGDNLKQRLQKLSYAETTIAQDFIILHKYGVVSEAMEKMQESPMDEFVTIITKLLES